MKYPSPLVLLLTLCCVMSASGSARSNTTSAAMMPDKDRAATPFVLSEHLTSADLPAIVVQYDPTSDTGYDFQRLDKLPLYVMLKSSSEIVLPVRYLREALQRMTGKQLPVVSGNDLSRGIILTTLQGAPPEIRNDKEILQALRSNVDDAYNANEAFFIRSEPRRLLVVTNTVQGFPVAVAELLDSVGYEVLGMGPNWTHVPDYSSKPLTFTLKRSGRPGFYIRQVAGASGQPGGMGTIFQKPLQHPADEPVEVSYYQRWLVGRRFASKSMPHFPGHSWQNYSRAVADKMLELKTTEGFLTEATTLGLDAERPAATPENNGDMWINTDPQPPRADGKPVRARVFVSDGKTWTEYDMLSSLGGLKLDISVPFVREMILDDLKAKAQAHFAKTPHTATEKLLVFGTDPEDGSRPVTLMRYKNWYPEYLQKEKLPFGRPYVLHGYKGLNQPREIWDPSSKSDVVYAFNNWLLREYDKWIDSIPTAERNARSGESKKDLVRASLYSYASHDVPPNFNLDPRIRVMIAGYPLHRGRGKWKNYATPIDMAQAFQKMLPREPSGDYWILSLAAYSDTTTTAIAHTSKSPETLHHQVQQLHDAGFRAVSAEMDFNFGRLGLAYYLYSKLLWNPKMGLQELNAVRDRWLQRSFGSGWLEMKEYFAFMAPESNVVNSPNKWGRAIRMIDAADAKIDPAQEPDAQKRLDDLKQFWYFYYLLESGQGTSTSPAMKEFLWKGQMSYMTAMHAVARNIFNTNNVILAVGPELSSGPAHYTHEETQQWWSKIRDFWQVTPVTEFSEVILANGRTGKEVDVNDLVSVKELQSPQPRESYFYYAGDAFPASFLTIARNSGDEVGFKLVWPHDPSQTRYSPKDVAYGIARWNFKTRSWEDLVDITTRKQSSNLVVDQKGARHQLVEVRYMAPTAGTYRIDVSKAGNVAKLASLAYDVATDSFPSVWPFSFSTVIEGYTQSPAYFYIPKGTRSLDFEVWGRGKEKRILRLYKGLPGTGWQHVRDVDVSRRGTHRVALNPGEDGSIASFYGDWFYMPQLYSVPHLWAKSPDALLVPREVADADGLNVIKE